MKHLVALQFVLWFGNGLLHKPVNWWLVSIPIMLYVVVDVIKYAVEQERMDRLYRERDTPEGAERFERFRKDRIRDLMNEINKNKN